MAGFREPLDIAEYQRKVGMSYAPESEPELPDRPVRRGWGPAVCSTETALVVRYTVWDVNGYYRSLGFAFPYRGITKRDLMRAYLDRLYDEYATYAFKILINARFRAMYDELPFGDPLIDKYLSHEIRKAATSAAVRRRWRGEEDVDQESVMDEWGLYSPQDGDDVPSPDQDSSRKRELSEPDPTVWRWDWGYYLWRSRSRDLRRLARWQELLVAEFAARGVRRQFAVGFLGQQPHRAVQVLVGEQLVLLLNEDVEPEQDLAIQMVASCTTTGEVAKEIDQHGVA
jgi:hypothetical protein